MASIIPENIKGNWLDIEYQVVKATVIEAVKTFDRDCKRQLNPPVQFLIAGELSARFTLQISENRSDKKLVDFGDYLAIDFPGPGLKLGKGFDWLRVELWQKNTEPYCGEIIAMSFKGRQKPIYKG